MARKAQLSRPVPGPSATPVSWLQHRQLHGLVVAALAVLLYANTLGHGFVLDDRVVLTGNSFVERGWSGLDDIFSHDTFQGYTQGTSGNAVVAGGRYRPFSLAVFAVVFSGAGENAFVFHLLAVVLYAFACWSLYRVLLRLVPGVISGTGPAIAFAAAVLFTVHPVHTEVVANVKSIDETLALLGGLGALYAAIRWQDAGRGAWLAAAAGSMLLGCLAKESAAAFLGIVPLALLVRRPAPPGRWFRGVWPVAAALAAGFLAYGLLRARAVGLALDAAAIIEPLNNPFLKFDGTRWVPFTLEEKAATIVYTLGRYLQLLVVPHPLTHDYYPRHFEAMHFSSPAVLLSFAAYTALLLFAMIGLARVSAGRASGTYALAWLGACVYLLGLVLVANIFFPIGTFMGERFLFLPSAGFSLAVATLGFGLVRRQPFVAGLVVVAVVFSAKTVLRNRAWASNSVLFEADIASSPNSAKLRNDLGTDYLERAMQQRQRPEAMRALLLPAFEHLSEAVRLHPTYFDPYLARGAAAFYLGRYDDAIASYRTAATLAPADPKARIGLAYSLREAARANDSAAALPLMLEAWENNPRDPEIAAWLADYYRRQPGQEAEAARWTERAGKLN